MVYGKKSYNNLLLEQFDISLNGAGEMARQLGAPADLTES